MLFTLSAGAEDLDPVSIEALKQTQALLRDSVQRQQAIDSNSKAKAVDKKVSKFAGSEENRQEIYNLSAEVMGRLVQESKGDADIMKKILDDAATDPEGFGNRFLTEEQKQKVKELSKKIEESRKPAPPR